jgi:3-hydroxybutyryl-CoA dehydrogenase
MNEGVFKSAAIIGAGTMGRGIAQVFLQSGFEVLLLDIDALILKDALREIKDIYSHLVEKGKVTSNEKDTYLSSLTVSKELERIKDYPLIIEAVKEELKVKKDLLKIMESMISPDAVITSNTSAFSINELASVLKKPDRFLGLHFFYPAPVMPLVEIISGKKTSEKVKDRIMSLMENMGKEPVSAQDSPGFIVNRLLLPYINNAIRLYSDGVASRDDIDKAMRLGTNHPMGPLELADHIGLDICLNILETFHRVCRDEGCRPSKLLKEMVSSGKLGKKTGQGFYKYDK